MYSFQYTQTGCKHLHYPTDSFQLYSFWMSWKTNYVGGLLRFHFWVMLVVNKAQKLEVAIDRLCFKMVRWCILKGVLFQNSRKLKQLWLNSKNRCVFVVSFVFLTVPFFSIFDSIVGGFSRNDSFEVQLLIRNKNYHTISEVVCICNKYLTILIFLTSQLPYLLFTGH